MFNSFFKKSASKRSTSDLEEKENCPFLNEADGKMKNQNLNENNNNNVQMPKGHSKVSEEDKDKCPFYQM